MVITKKHVESVADVSVAFKKYIKSWKRDSAKRACVDGARMSRSINHRRGQL